MYIDPHVHLRDFKQKNKETVKHGLEVARDSGLSAVLDMPNTDPPIMTRELVENRLKLARNANVPEVFYGLYMGLTADPEQIKRAVGVYREFPQVIGMKLYAGHSVGNLGVIDQEDQSIVYQTLQQEEFDGFLAIHAEKESELHSEEWNPKKPITHCHARPEKAEIESIRDQLNHAYTSGLKAKLHIAHISTPGAVSLVMKAKDKNMDISCGICPHHFVYDWQAMHNSGGILMKMNPPLRSPKSRQKMFNHLKAGNIDWIETDHAPHTSDEKNQDPFMSGIPGLASWPVFAEYLRRHEFNDKLIEEITFNAVAERIGLDVPKNTLRHKDHRGDYVFNAYEIIEKDLGMTELL